MNTSERKEEVKQYQKLIAFHEAQAQELERQVREVRSLKQEAARHRREAKTLERKIAQLRGAAGNTEEQA